MTTGQFKIKFQNQSHIYWLGVTYSDISYRYLLVTFWFLYIINTFWIFYFWLVTYVVYADGNLFSNYTVTPSLPFFSSPISCSFSSFLLPFFISLSLPLFLFFSPFHLYFFWLLFCNYLRYSPMPITMLNSSGSGTVPVLWGGQISVVR